MVNQWSPRAYDFPYDEESDAVLHPFEPAFQKIKQKKKQHQERKHDRESRNKRIKREGRA